MIGSYKSIKTVALPIEGKIIVLDAGHGLPDGGAVGSNGTVEQKLNLNVSKKLQQLLEQSGAHVLMTRTNDNTISNINGLYYSNKLRITLTTLFRLRQPQIEL